MDGGWRSGARVRLGIAHAGIVLLKGRKWTFLRFCCPILGGTAHVDLGLRVIRPLVFAYSLLNTKKIEDLSL